MFQNLSDFAASGRLGHYNGTASMDVLTPDTKSADNVRIELNGGGDFNLARGDDTFFGGDGQDTISGGTGADFLSGGNGDDLLRGGKQEDSLHGGNGNDRIVGQGNADQIFGNNGNDVLNGGGGNDTFIFADGDGQDTIQDFDATNDAEKLDLSGVSSITMINDLTGPGGAASQVGSDVLIDAGAGNSILLVGVSLADLGADDFVF